jgi:DNA-binding PadR family transcriptional regulator
MDTEEYNNSLIPHEIRNAIKSLNDEVSWGIYLYLATKGTSSFSDISKKFESNSSTTSYQLKKLLKGGLIECRLEKEPGKNTYSYYTLSNTGKSLLEMICNMIKEKVSSIGHHNKMAAKKKPVKGSLPAKGKGKKKTTTKKTETSTGCEA